MGFFSQQRHLVASFAYVVLPDDPRDPRIGAYGTLHVDVVALFDERGLQFAAQFQAHHWNICQRERERENSHRISTELDKTKERERILTLDVEFPGVLEDRGDQLQVLGAARQVLAAVLGRHQQRQRAGRHVAVQRDLTSSKPQVYEVLPTCSRWSPTDPQSGAVASHFHRKMTSRGSS